MAEYNIEPDYAAWWKKKNLTKEQLVWLMLGVNPDDLVKRENLSQKTRGDEEQNWLSSFNEYLSELTLWIGRDHDQYMRLLKSDDKNTIFQEAYDNHLKIYDSCFEFVIQKKALTKNKVLEDYKNTQNYQSFETENVGSEVQAFSILLGLSYKHFERFMALEKRCKTEPRDDNDFVAYVRFTSDEKWFYSQYRKFLVSIYGEYAQFSLIKTFEKAQALKIWNGSFLEYCEKLYDNGFIFKNEIYKRLAEKGIKLNYTHDAWAIQFYKHWTHKGGWTISEACNLFKGQSPDKKRSFEDLSQSSEILWLSEEQIWSYSLLEAEYELLTEKLERNCSVENIKRYQYGEEYLYKPNDIVTWLMKNTLHMPPKALLHVLEIFESNESEEIREKENEAATELKIQKAIEIARPKKPLKASINELYENAMPIWDAYIREHGVEPTREITAQLLKDRYSLHWEVSSIERELSAHELQLRYQEYKRIQ